MPAKGNAEWTGDLKSGTGTFSAGDGGIAGEYSVASRFEDGPGANPEQLIAAAHSSCYSMFLSGVLSNAGTPPEWVRTDAAVTIRRTDDGPTITTIALSTVARVPGVDDAAFQEAAQTAKAGCPVGKALAAVAEITLEARLDG
jgi:lipoyl-dependent peroxiredoxin